MVIIHQEYKQVRIVSKYTPCKDRYGLCGDFFTAFNTIPVFPVNTGPFSNSVPISLSVQLFCGTLCHPPFDKKSALSTRFRTGQDNLFCKPPPLVLPFVVTAYPRHNCSGYSLDIATQILSDCTYRDTLSCPSTYVVKQHRCFTPSAHRASSL